jgi:hypothetical protein
VIYREANVYKPGPVKIGKKVWEIVTTKDLYHPEGMG